MNFLLCYQIIQLNENKDVFVEATNATNGNEGTKITNGVMEMNKNTKNKRMLSKVSFDKYTECERNCKMFSFQFVHKSRW